MGLKEIETTESTGERYKVSLMCFGFMFWIQCNKRFFVIHFMHYGLQHLIKKYIITITIYLFIS